MDHVRGGGYGDATGYDAYMGRWSVRLAPIFLHFAVPKQNSSGGNERLGSINKQGDRYLRSLFTAGALAVIRYAKIYGTRHRPWLTALLARRPTKVAASALLTLSRSGAARRRSPTSPASSLNALMNASQAPEPVTVLSGW